MSAPDERTVQVDLAEPQNTFLYVLGSPLLFPWPRHVYDERGPDWSGDLPLVGNGPFVLAARETAAVVDQREGGRMTLSAAPHWYGARRNVAEVALELYASPEEAEVRWAAGEHDLVYEFLAELGRFSVDQATVVDRAPGGFTDYIGLDARRAPLDDDRVRRAFAHAIDRRRVPHGVSAVPAVTGGMLPPALPAHSHRVAPAYDPDRARALMSDAGHPEGEVTITHFAVQSYTVGEIAAQLEAVGFRVRPTPVYSNAAMSASIRDEANAFMWSAGYAYPDPGRGFLEPAIREFPGLYRDERLTELLARAALLHDTDERLRLYREFERIWIGEQAAVVPLVYNDRLLWRRPWLTGLWANAIARATFAEAMVGARG